MKYDYHELTDPNTSHVMVLDMVGSGKRVLDVGCATGYLDEVLTARGNIVTGVELDPEAAERARPHLARLVIGNLETIDLVAALGAGGFDVVVFADVLEHLTNPLRTLRQAPALLAPGGSVVVSIPNIAHGSVRLAMLQGRFEYRDLGLLDDTHLRFFTRSSLIDLHDQAGLTPVDSRRVVHDPFATEIPLDPADFPAPLVDRLRADPETTTYQFVIRSVPTQGVAGTAALSGDDAGEELVARHQELEQARAQLRAVSEVAMGSGPPVAGMVIAAASRPASVGLSLDELRAMVMAAELGRRLDGWAIRTFETGSDQPRPAANGTPIEPLTSPGGSLVAPIDTLDALVVTGTTPDGADFTWSKAMTRFTEDGGAVYLAGAVTSTTSPGDLSAFRGPRAAVGWAPPEQIQARRDRVPDPLVLADRLFDRASLAHRGQYLRLAGTLPTAEYLLICLDGHGRLEAGALARTVSELADSPDLSVVVVAGDHDDEGAFATALGAQADRARVVGPLDALDLVAVIASATLVISDDAGLVWLALALGRPTIGLDERTDTAVTTVASWLGDPDVVAASPASLLAGRPLAERRASDTRLLQPPRDALELFVDELAGAMATTPARRLTSSLPVRLAEATERIKVLDLVNTHLRASMAKQREEFGRIARRANLGDTTEVSHLERRVLEDRLRRAEERLQTLRSDAEAARTEAEAARQELEATYATRTMRTLAPARRMYGRLRRLS